MAQFKNFPRFKLSQLPFWPRKKNKELETDDSFFAEMPPSSESRPITKKPRLAPIVWDTERYLHSEVLHKSLHRGLKDGLHVLYNRTPFREERTMVPLLAGTDINALLQDAAGRNYGDWAVVMAVGNIFEQQNKIVEQIHALLAEANEDVLIYGQLIDKEGFYCGLHEQFFLVNLKLYTRLKYPKFGKPAQGVQMLQNYEAGPSIHSNYTPRWLRPLGTTSQHQTGIGGWGLINASLAANLRVLNISDEIRKLKVYLYPEEENEKLNKNIDLIYQLEDLQNPSQRAALAHLILKRFNLVSDSNCDMGFKEASNCLFVFNSEALLPFPDWQPGFMNPIDTYVGPCSGFQDIAFTKMCGVHEKTELIYFDYTDESLRLKKYILENFSGRISDLPSLIDQIYQEFPWNEVYTGNISYKIEEILSCFQNDANQFFEFWQKFKLLKKTFVKVNLLTNPSTLTHLFEKNKKIIFNITDIYLAQNEVVRGLPKMQQLYTALESHCAQWPHLYLTGQNLNQQRFFSSLSHFKKEPSENSLNF